MANKWYSRRATGSRRATTLSNEGAPRPVPETTALNRSTGEGARVASANRVGHAANEQDAAIPDQESKGMISTKRDRLRGESEGNFKLG
jgi:hypothetical protein